MSFGDQSKAVFGRRDRVVDIMTTPQRAPPPPMRLHPAIIPSAVLVILILAVVGVTVWGLSGAQRMHIEAAQAEGQAAEIVNQPVTHLLRTRAVEQLYPGWFHPGADRPDFDTVDVRATQQPIYERYTYVTSDLNPTEMFIGRELEFNAATKYLYADRSLPKKRLSEGEMLEINRLYRVIGRDQRASALRLGEMAGTTAMALLLAGGIILLRRRRSDGAPAQAHRI